MISFTVVLGVLLAMAGAQGTLSDDDQSYFKPKRGLTVVPSPSLAPAAVPAQVYYPAAALTPYFGAAGVAKSAYVPAAAAPLLPRPATAFYPGVPTAAAAAYPAYPAPAVSGYSVPAYTYAIPASVPASGHLPSYPAVPAAAVPRVPHMAYPYYG